MKKQPEYCTLNIKQYNKFVNKIITRKAIKTVLVIRDFDTAIKLAKTKSVIYITDDERKYKIFRAMIVNNINFGSDDKAYLIKYEEWKNIKQFIEEENMPKFDVAIMNPPYSNKESNNLDINIVNVLNDKICDKKIIIMPNKLYHKFKSVDDFYNNYLISQTLYKTSDVFPELSTNWEYVSIYDVDYTKHSDTFIVKINNSEFEINGNLNERLEVWNKIKYGSDIVNIINKYSNLYNKLKKDFGTMCNDCKNFIYEENKVGLYGIKKPEQKKLERVKTYLSNGTYKYCLFKGSGNHDYDEVQEYTGDISVFNGQICWLTNSETVYENMKYWMNCPLFDFWRRFYFKGCKFAACWNYINIPALDFSLSCKNFKKLVDKLNDFNEEEKKCLSKFNVHNIQ